MLQGGVGLGFRMRPGAWVLTPPTSPVTQAGPPLPLGHTGSLLVVPRPSRCENQVKARLTQLHLVDPALCMSDSELRVINNNKGIISHTEMS